MTSIARANQQIKNKGNYVHALPIHKGNHFPYHIAYVTSYTDRALLTRILERNNSGYYSRPTRREAMRLSRQKSPRRHQQ